MLNALSLIRATVEPTAPLGFRKTLMAALRRSRLFTEANAVKPVNDRHWDEYVEHYRRQHGVDPEPRNYVREFPGFHLSLSFMISVNNSAIGARLALLVNHVQIEFPVLYTEDISKIGGLVSNVKSVLVALVHDRPEIAGKQAWFIHDVNEFSASHNYKMEPLRRHIAEMFGIH